MKCVRIVRTIVVKNMITESVGKINVSKIGLHWSILIGLMDINQNKDLVEESYDKKQSDIRDA